MKIKYVLFIPMLRQNFLSNSSLEEKGFKISFFDGEVLIGPKGKYFNHAIVIGVQEGGLYKLKGHLETTMVHNNVIPSELWYKRLDHLHYRELLIMSNMVIGLLNIQVNHEGICKGCAEG